MLWRVLLCTFVIYVCGQVPSYDGQSFVVIQVEKTFNFP
eukprot:gene13563-21216_t